MKALLFVALASALLGLGLSLSMFSNKREALYTLAYYTGVWWLLPGKAQGWLCDCDTCRGGP